MRIIDFCISHIHAAGTLMHARCVQAKRPRDAAYCTSGPAARPSQLTMTSESVALTEPSCGLANSYTLLLASCKFGTLQSQYRYARSCLAPDKNRASFCLYRTGSSFHVDCESVAFVEPASGAGCLGLHRTEYCICSDSRAHVERFQYGCRERAVSSLIFAGIYCLISLRVGEANRAILQKNRCDAEARAETHSFPTPGFFQVLIFKVRSGHVGLDRLPVAHQPHIL